MSFSIRASQEILELKLYGYIQHSTAKQKHKSKPRFRLASCSSNVLGKFSKKRHFWVYFEFLPSRFLRQWGGFARFPGIWYTSTHTWSMLSTTLGYQIFANVEIKKLEKFFFKNSNFLTLLAKLEIFRNFFQFFDFLRSKMA